MDNCSTDAKIMNKRGERSDEYKGKKTGGIKEGEKQKTTAHAVALAPPMGIEPMILP